MAIDNEGPDPIDKHVGARVRARRHLMNMSQATLAGHLGVTFQQVQKYERGANRISASVLYRIATALSAPMGYFFEGLKDTVKGRVDAESAAQVAAADALFGVPGGPDVARAFTAVAPNARGPLVILLRALAEGSDAAEESP